MENEQDVNNQEQPNMTDDKNTKKRLRDEKGHFTSSEGTACTHEKTTKPNRKKKEEEDSNTVKIRIIKDEEPLPPKDFEGRLDDIKERTAINFIKSVCRRNPRCISIDGKLYYSNEEHERLQKLLAEEKECREIEIKAVKGINDLMEQGIETINFLESILKKVKRSRFIWRSIAIGVTAAFLCSAVFRAISKNSQQPESNQPAQTATIENSK